MSTHHPGCGCPIGTAQACLSEEYPCHCHCHTVHPMPPFDAANSSALSARAEEARRVQGHGAGLFTQEIGKKKTVGVLTAEQHGNLAECGLCACDECREDAATDGVIAALTGA